MMDGKKLQPALTVRICYNYNIEILMKTMIIAIDTDIIPTFSVNLILIFSKNSLMNIISNY